MLINIHDRVLDPTQAGKEARSLHEKLSRAIVGQPEAVEQIVNMYQLHIAGLAAPGRPVGNFLFLGLQVRVGRGPSKLRRKRWWTIPVQ
jgi:ATP-dependent Clp protease ATP-binding subunit ClpA